MFIVLEGTDCAGKSTLADAIQAEIERRLPGEDIERVHSSQLHNDPLDEYALEYEAYKPGNHEHFIIDRLHWGETIYGPLYRNESKLTPAAFRWTELYLKTRGATTWHVTAALETIENRMRTRGEEFLQPEDVRHVWEGFTAISEIALTTGGTAVTDRFTPERLAKQIVNEAIYNESVAEESFRPEYIGRALPTVLLVGDVQGTSDPGATAAPFMPRGTSCGGFLLDALPELWWHQVGIVNSRETNLTDLVDALYYPTVIALGAEASKVLTEEGIEHSVVPHPQKIKRFHNAMKDQYGSLIRTMSTQTGNELQWPKSSSTTYDGVI